MAMCTGNQRRKTEGREYDTPLPLPCTPKELDVLLDKWIANGILNPTRFLESLRRKKGGILASAACTTMYNIPSQNAGRSVG